MSCAINLGTSVLILGGAYGDAESRVSEYDEAGWVRDLPQLLHKRVHLGCSYYANDEGTKVVVDLDIYYVEDCSEELLRQQSSDIKNQLGHSKPPIRCSSLVLYGIRAPIIGPFRAWKPTILRASKAPY